jgi:hypothetical protein
MNTQSAKTPKAMIVAMIVSLLAIIPGAASAHSCQREYNNYVSALHRADAWCALPGESGAALCEAAIEWMDFYEEQYNACEARDQQGPSGG